MYNRLQLEALVVLAFGLFVPKDAVGAAKNLAGEVEARVGHELRRCVAIRARYSHGYHLSKSYQLAGRKLESGDSRSGRLDFMRAP